MQSTPLSIAYCDLRYNSVPERLGGAIHADNSFLTIVKSNMSNNYRGMGGAAISLKNCRANVENCLIAKDATYYPPGGEQAGAILMIARMSDCTKS